MVWTKISFYFFVTLTDLEDAQNIGRRVLYTHFWEFPRDLKQRNQQKFVAKNIYRHVKYVGKNLEINQKHGNG